MSFLFSVLVMFTSYSPPSAMPTYPSGKIRFAGEDSHIMDSTCGATTDQSWCPTMREILP